MNFWRYAQLTLPSYLLVTVAFAQTPATPTAPAGLARGADRQHVREVQGTLEALALDPGPVDGVMGPRTKAALTRFQQREGLSATGTLDEQTRARLAARKQQHVVELQKALKSMGLDPGPDDGMMGPRTRAALLDYAKAPAPSPATPASQLVDRFKRAYDASLMQSP